MARSAQVGLVLAMLVVGGAAVQLAPRAGGGTCGRGFVEYEHLDENHPHACLVYCVPKGLCVEKEEAGAFADFNFSNLGDCHGLGFTEPAALGDLTNPIMEKLQSFEGPCKGMKVLKFKKPEQPASPTPQPTSPEPERPKKPASPTPQPSGPKLPGGGQGLLCKDNKTIAFKAIKDMEGHYQCTIYCVPSGICLDLAKAGKLAYLGVSGMGLCDSAGYTVREEPTAGATHWINHLHGPCKGMTQHKFRKPARVRGVAKPDAGVPAAEPEEEGHASIAQAPGPAAGRSCGPDHYPFRAVRKHFSGQSVCSAYCVPDGPCRGMAVQGRLKSLGITAEGGCKEGDFPEPVSLNNVTLFMIKSAAGEACKGMTVQRFQTPAPEQPVVEKPALDPAAGRSCAQDHYPFRAVRKHFGGRTVCSVFCVPDGLCYGKAQAGLLNSQFGITSEGRCTQQDFPEPVPVRNMTLFMIKTAAGGACTGMTVHTFQTPAPEPPAEEQPAVAQPAA